MRQPLQPANGTSSATDTVQRSQLLDAGGSVVSNLEGTLLTSAARTATTTTATQTNYNGRGVVVTIDVTAVGTGTFTAYVLAVDPVLGSTYGLNTGLAITATGTKRIHVYPGIAAGGDQFASAVVPRSWAVGLNKSDASAWTFAVYYSLIV